MATDATSQPDAGREGQRKPVTIDLAAREVDRKEAEQAEVAAAGPADAVDTAAENAAHHRAEDIRDGVDEPVTPAALAGEAEHTAPPATVQARRATSFGALLVAALVGGIVAAICTISLQRSGALDAMLPPQGDVAAMAAEVANVRQEMAALRDSAPDGAASLARVQEQTATLERAIEELRSRPSATAADPEGLARLDGRVKALEALRPTGGADPALAARLATLAGEVAALGKTPAAAAGPSSADIARRVDALGERLGALETRPAPDLSGLETSQTEMRAEIAGLTTRLEGAVGVERVDALEAALDSTRTEAAKSAALAPAVAADALAAALASGAPFQGGFDALRGLGMDKAVLDSLQPYAAGGLPTLAALGAAFEAQAADIDVAPPIPAGTGTLERLLQSAGGLIEVRPAKPVAGNDPAAIVARIRGGIAAGDLKAALDDWRNLPEAAQAKTAAWAKDAGARAAADDLATRLRSEALSRLKTEG